MSLCDPHPRICSQRLVCLPLCAGIRQLQLVLLKVALLLGVEVHVHVEFKNLLEPPGDQQNLRKNTFYSAQHCLLARLQP